MEIRRILLNIDFDAFSPALVRCAEELARRFGADLVGIAAAEPYPVMTGGRGAGVAATLYADERAAIEAQLRALEVNFRKSLSPDTKTEWRCSVETPNHSLVSAARSADLIMAGSAAAGGFRRRVDLGELIIAAGRPVLVAAAGAETIKGETIVVGWKDTREARRAVSDALPMLRLAKKVVAVAIEDGDTSMQKESLADLLAWLGRHEIEAIGDLHAAQGDAAQQLEDLSRGFGADLVVTGGYGRSRLQEWLFGGMTRGLLTRHTTNRFMSN